MNVEKRKSDITEEAQAKEALRQRTKNIIFYTRDVRFGSNRVIFENRETAERNITRILTTDKWVIFSIYLGKKNRKN